MSFQPKRIGLVGLGGHGRRIQDALAAVDTLQVIAVHDPRVAEAKAAAERFDAVPTATYEALLRHNNLDAVVLVTPNALHRSQTLAAVAAGMDVFVEKPIANTVADADAMVEAARQAGRILMVGHNIRWGRAARIAKAWLDEGKLGEVVSVEIHYSADNVQKGTHVGWRSNPDLCPLLPMMQLGIHAIDLVHYLLGPINHVYAHSRSVLTGPGVVDNVTATYVLVTGVVGTAVSNYCTPDRFELRFSGTKGIVELNWLPHTLTWLPRGTRTTQPEHHDYSTFDLEDMVAQFQAFSAALRTRQPPETDGHAGRRALAVVEAMAQSAASKQAVAVAA